MNARYAFLLATCLALPLLSACAPQDSLNSYKAGDVGRAIPVEYGTVTAVREVKITGDNSGTGGLLGAGTGAGAASYIGDGSGRIWAIAGGALLGAITGSVAEQAAVDHKGYEYTIQKDNGPTMMIVQNQAADEPVFAAGTRIMLQTGGSYQRLLPAAPIPPAPAAVPVAAPAVPVAPVVPATPAASAVPAPQPQ